MPRVALLANGRFTTVLSEAGGGYAAYRGYQLTRWSPDPVRDAAGVFLYLRDLDSGVTWSATAQPVLNPRVGYEASFAPGVAFHESRIDGVRIRVETSVADGHDCELRRVAIDNRRAAQLRLELTSYVEVALADPLADWLHPAFTRLFVQTFDQPGTGALLASRRQRSPDDDPLWMVHSLLVEGRGAELQCETDRARFVGRGRTTRAPRALEPGAELSGTVGSVLDPVLSIRRVIEVQPGDSAAVLLLTGAGRSRKDAEHLAATFDDPRSAAAEFSRSQDAAARLFAELEIPVRQSDDLTVVTESLLYGSSARRAAVGQAVDPGILAAAGLSGRHPVVLLEIESDESVIRGRAALRVVEFWRRSGIAADVLVLHSADAPHSDVLSVEAARLHVADGFGTTVIRRAADLGGIAVDTVRAVARLDLADFARSPAPHRGVLVVRPASRPPSAPTEVASQHASPARDDLRFFNGYGGFTPDGSEYVIRLDGSHPARLPLLPWVNVIANERFGFFVSERGGGCTWSVNSRENRLSPWFNDPVCDPHGEAIYVQALDSGDVWSPAFGPCPAPVPYTVRHGFGYTTWTHRYAGIEQELVQFAARDEPAKVSILRLRNDGTATRSLAICAYVEWVLGALPHQTAPFVDAEVIDGGRAILAANPVAGEYSELVAFSALRAAQGTRPRHVTDRRCFLGTHGSVSDPAWLRQAPAAEDAVSRARSPCAALSVEITIAPGESADVVWLLGQETSSARAHALLARYADASAASVALEQVRSWWRTLLGRVRVETPVPAIDLMVNGWASYQNLSCRMWGRSALYQSGGAFGYRDQLQDSTALLYHDPAITRRQILLHAAQQFVEGDVLHWWHPPVGKGIRTRFSDDLLWLPYAACFYIACTGDDSILDEDAPFLTAETIAPPDDEIFVYPRDSGATGSLYEHCIRSLDRSLAVGRHGLPHIGTGDWNDGMNRVGREGRGESVWLGFFLCSILREFIPLCERRNEPDRARRYRTHLDALQTALNRDGWDGEWYRRAYYDDGTPLGSRVSDECRIDAIAQAWSVLSGVAPPERAASALDALEEQLVSEREGLIRLLAPPFDRTPRDPGYIKGYLPGVRENGGQYTHGALWAVRALAESGRADRAAGLLEMLSPCTRGGSESATAVYMAEPYVVAADVYGVKPHVGRAGWTWYTGSAGWIMRVAVESVLGITLRAGTHLVVQPALPRSWPEFRFTYTLPTDDTSFTLRVRRGESSAAVLDDRPLPPEVDGSVAIPIARDGRAHRVEIVFAADAVVRYRPGTTT